MKKFLVSLFLSVCLFCVIGCTSNEGQIKTSDTSSDGIPAMEKHIVSITKDNYQKYLTIETNSVAGSSSTTSYHYFKGALTYAFYDNLIITYDFRSGDTTTERTLSLNVGGCGTIKTDSSKYGSSSYEITNVSGTVIYWI